MKVSKAEINKIRRKYMIPGGAAYQIRTLNAIHISTSTSLKHELAKCIGAYMIRKYGDIKLSDQAVQLLGILCDRIRLDLHDFPKNPKNFITEAIPKRDKDRRVDLVLLEDETWYEFETNKKEKKEESVTIYV